MRLCVTLVFVLLTLAMVGGCGSKQTHVPPVQPKPPEMPNIADLVQQSQFIFKGTVKALNAATMPDVPVTSSTAVIVVDEVFQAAQTLGDYRGKDITVQLKETDTVTVGQQAVFFTNGWLIGENIAVQAVGQVDVPDDAARLRQQVRDATQMKVDNALQAHIANVELVVVGKVVRTEAADVAENERITEHNPVLWTAVIEIESVEKGTAPEKTVAVLFSNSIDVMWHSAPKFRANQEGIWILRRNAQEGLDIDGYAALNPLDFHPKTELERIRALIKGGQ